MHNVTHCLYQNWSFSMRRNLVVLLVAIAAIASMSLVSVSAHNAPGAVAGTAAQAAKCTDAKFLTALGKDLTDLGTTFQAVKMDDVASMAKTTLMVASSRQKYEDMTDVPAECVTTQLAAIIAFANSSDILALGMAIKSDPANAADYAKALTGQSERFTKSMKQVLIEAGLATPTP
jgi:hypothetical protein